MLFHFRLTQQAYMPRTMRQPFQHRFYRYLPDKDSRRLPSMVCLYPALLLLRNQKDGFQKDRRPADRHTGAEKHTFQTAGDIAQLYNLGIGCSKMWAFNRAHIFPEGVRTIVLTLPYHKNSILTVKQIGLREK